MKKCSSEHSKNRDPRRCREIRRFLRQIEGQKDMALPSLIKEELTAWFGNQVEDWHHLRTDLIKHVLPEQPPISTEEKSPAYLTLNDIWICGNHTNNASIEGTIISGKQTATAIIDAMNQ